MYFTSIYKKNSVYPRRHTEYKYQKSFYLLPRRDLRFRCRLSTEYILFYNFYSIPRFSFYVNNNLSNVFHKIHFFLYLLFIKSYRTGSIAPIQRRLLFLILFCAPSIENRQNHPCQTRNNILSRKSHKYRRNRS